MSRPRVLFVGRGRHRLPLSPPLAKKWDAVERELDYRFLGASDDSRMLESERFRLSPPRRPRRLDGALFHLLLPFRVRRELREFRPDTVVAADPFVGAAVLAGRSLARVSAPLIVEVHGDWRTFTRLYGSPVRKVLARAADALAVFVLRRADATRALSGFTSGLVAEARGHPADATFATFSDLSAFTAKPVAELPERPTALFVGVLEAYKNVDGLAAAWRRVAERMPEAKLVVVGKGSRRRPIDELVRELPERVEHVEEIDPAGVATRLDEATLLVLPSWPEGLGRVVMESFARGRGVVATAAGGVLDLVEDGREGLLVPRADVDALAAALLRVLGDRALAERLGKAAHERFRDWDYTPEQFARSLRELAERTIAAGRDAG